MYRVKILLVCGILMYVIVDYDDVYCIDVVDYVEEMLSCYLMGLGNLIGFFVVFYLDYIVVNFIEIVIGNLLLMVVEEEEGLIDLDIKKVYCDYYVYSIVSSVFNGEDIILFIEVFIYIFIVIYIDIEYVVEVLVE